MPMSHASTLLATFVPASWPSSWPYACCAVTVTLPVLAAGAVPGSAVASVSPVAPLPTRAAADCGIRYSVTCRASCIGLVSAASTGTLVHWHRATAPGNSAMTGAKARVQPPIFLVCASGLVAV